MVYFHYTIREPGTKAVLASTSTSHSGRGCPHVAAIDKGHRIPRGWELVLPGATCLKRMTSITLGPAHTRSSRALLRTDGDELALKQVTFNTNLTSLIVYRYESRAAQHRGHDSRVRILVCM